MLRDRVWIQLEYYFMLPKGMEGVGVHDSLSKIDKCVFIQKRLPHQL